MPEEVAAALLLRTDAVGKLCNHDCAGITVIALLFGPCDHVWVTVLLRGLAEYIRVQKPTHSLRRLAYSRRRGGTSSGLTGHDFRTSSQSSFEGSLRKTSASSSASKNASKCSPGRRGLIVRAHRSHAWRQA